MADSKNEEQGLHADPEMLKGELHVDPKITESLGEKPRPRYTGKWNSETKSYDVDPKTIERLRAEREAQGWVVTEELKERLARILAGVHAKDCGCGQHG